MELQLQQSLFKLDFLSYHLLMALTEPQLGLQRIIKHRKGRQLSELQRIRIWNNKHCINNRNENTLWKNVNIFKEPDKEL